MKMILQLLHKEQSGWKVLLQTEVHFTSFCVFYTRICSVILPPGWDGHCCDCQSTSDGVCRISADTLLPKDCWKVKRHHSCRALKAPPSWASWTRRGRLRKQKIKKINAVITAQKSKRDVSCELRSKSGVNQREGRRKYCNVSSCDQKEGKKKSPSNWRRFLMNGGRILFKKRE